MRAADAAMYQAKGHGRGRVEQFSEALANQLADRAQLEIDLRSAIERDQFALVYQPQVRLTDGAIVAAERSEEQTSELQSPIPNSDAVFCLKTTQTNTTLRQLLI